MEELLLLLRGANPGFDSSMKDYLNFVTGMGDLITMTKTVNFGSKPRVLFRLKISNLG